MYLKQTLVYKYMDTDKMNNHGKGVIYCTIPQWLSVIVSASNRYSIHEHVTVYLIVQL